MGVRKVCDRNFADLNVFTRINSVLKIQCGLVLDARFRQLLFVLPELQRYLKKA